MVTFQELEVLSLALFQPCVRAEGRLHLRVSFVRADFLSLIQTTRANLRLSGCSQLRANANRPQCRGLVPVPLGGYTTLSFTS